MISFTTLLTYLGMIFAVVIICTLIGLPIALILNWRRKRKELKRIPDTTKREVEDAKENRQNDRGIEARYIPVEPGVKPSRRAGEGEFRIDERDNRAENEGAYNKPASNEPMAHKRNIKPEREPGENKAGSESDWFTPI